MPESYDRLAAYTRRIAILGSVGALSSWDQETYMPRKAAEARSEQSALLAELIHGRITSPELGDLISAAEADKEVMGDGELGASVREYRRDYDKATKIPGELVADLARTGSRAQEAWKDARERSDFEGFAPWLEKVIGLSRRKAECLGIPESAGKGGELYDALLDDYEPATSAKDIEAVFTPLAKELADLLQELSYGKHPGASILDTHVPADSQHKFGLFIIEKLGFDIEAGRLDVTTHPFCSGFGPGDTRLTTRYRDERFTDALYGTMHECGHGLYEQGLPKHERFGEPLADSVSLGIHESQSRLWENLVGRSLPFWEWALPHAKEMLGGDLRGATPETMFKAVNTAEPSFIRVEADEATYNAHVFVRFEIERAVFSGDLKVRDIPGVWNEKYKQYLGITPPDHRRGCLQDVHWSFGLLGYFPTYTLGNIYACQLWDKINEDIPGLDDQMRKGEFGELLAWLRDKIHRHGRRYPAPELAERATGKPLSAEPLLRHLRGRLKPVYGV